MKEQYRKLFKGFGYAFAGIWNTMRTERNFRIHLTCIGYMLGFLLPTGRCCCWRAPWC